MKRRTVRWPLLCLLPVMVPALVVLQGVSTAARADEAAPTGPPAQPAAAHAAALVPAPAKKGPDRLDLDATAIRGNQELPKVLYIVPWKDPGLAAPAGRPLNSLLDEALAPVDREVFRRQMSYFHQLYAAPGAVAADAGQAR